MSKQRLALAIQTKHEGLSCRNLPHLVLVSMKNTWMNGWLRTGFVLVMLDLPSMSTWRLWDVQMGDKLKEKNSSNWEEKQSEYWCIHTEHEGVTDWSWKYGTQLPSQTAGPNSTEKQRENLDNAGAKFRKTERKWCSCGSGNTVFTFTFVDDPCLQDYRYEGEEGHLSVASGIHFMNLEQKGEDWRERTEHTSVSLWVLRAGWGEQECS